MSLEKQIDHLLKARRVLSDERSSASIAGALGKLSQKWLEADNFYRVKAVRRLAERSNFSAGMAAEMIDSVFTELTEEKINAFLHSELGDARALDHFVKDAVSGLRKKAAGPALIVHIFSGSSPQSSVMSLAMGLLLKSANILKPSGADAGFLDIFLESLKAADADLAQTALILPPNARQDLKKALKAADAVVAFGQDSTLEKIRRHIPVKSRFLAYGHRMSISLFTKEALTPAHVDGLAAKAGRDVWAMDQRGCLSSLVLFAEKGGKIRPYEFAQKIAESLEKLARQDAPSVSRDRLIRHERLKSFYQIKKVKGEPVYLSSSIQKGLFSVLYDEKMDLEALKFKSEQTLFVKGWSDEAKIWECLAPLKKSLQGAALEAAPSQREGLAEKLSAAGFNRVCHAGDLQNPPLFWHHDGKHSLLPLVFWTDLE